MQRSGQFTEELRRYRWPKSRTTRAHLQRWLDDPGREAVWARIHKRAPLVEAEELIRLATRARARAAGLPAILKGLAARRKEVLSYHRPLVRKALASTRPLREIAKVMEDAAIDFRLSDWFVEIDDHYNFSDLPPGAVSRKDQKGTRARRAFCFILGHFLHKKCGHFLDGEVATLSDIAFPPPSDRPTTAEDVRLFRKPRKQSTSRKAR